MTFIRGDESQGKDNSCNNLWWSSREWGDEKIDSTLRWMVRLESWRSTLLDIVIFSHKSNKESIELHNTLFTVENYFDRWNGRGGSLQVSTSTILWRISKIKKRKLKNYSFLQVRRQMLRYLNAYLKKNKKIAKK